MMNRRADAENEWQLEQLANDTKFNQWIERRYNVTVQDLIARVHDGVIRINQNTVVTPQQMVDFYQMEQSLNDDAEDADQNYIDKDDLRSKIKDRTEVLKATSMINQKEYLKSTMGLILVGLGIVLAVKIGKKLYQDASDENKRQNMLNLKYAKVKPTIWSSRKVKKLIYANTKAQNFSNKLWADIDSLKATVDDVISKGVAVGMSNQDMAKYLQKELRKNVTNKKYVTERLARTESAKVEFQVQYMMAKEQGFHYVKWHAEPSACKACREISEEQPTKYDAGVYRLSDVPDIPVHPNCRCSISTYYPDKE